MSPQWIVIGVLIALVYFIYIKKKPISSERRQGKSDKLSEDDMVECKQCGTYTSLNEALLKEGQYFCCDECLNA